MTPFVLLATYAAGIAMVRFVAPWQMPGQIIVAGFMVLSWVLLHRSRWAWLPFLGLLMAAGFLNACRQLHPPAGAGQICYFADSAPRTCEGLVLSVEKMAAGGYRLLAEAHRIVSTQGSAAVSGAVLVTVAGGDLLAEPGQMVRWRARLNRPGSFGNPGEFDYPLYLAARGIHTTAFMKHAEDIVILINHPEQQTQTLQKWRHLLAAHIEKSVPEQATGLVQSLLLGMHGAISKTQRMVLAATGVAHLFAISGLHFGLLAALLYQLGRWLYTRSEVLVLRCPPQRVLPLLLIFPLAAYLLLTGNSWATRRAFLMAAAVALLLVSGRRTSPLALLSAVALCLLWFCPLAMFQPGFQLSFAGVAGILVWLPRWQRHFFARSRLVRWPVTLVLTTVSASLATAPATLWHFHQFAPAGLLTNLIAIPLVAWGAVPLGLLGIAAFPCSAMISAWGLKVCAWLVTLAVAIAQDISSWPGLAVIECYLTISELILLIGILLILLPRGNSRKSWFCRIGLVLSTLAGAWLTQPQIGEFQVTAFSVGQGDATLVSLAGQTHYLIDGGGLPGAGLDPGEQLVAPALGRMGIDRLHGIILTHNHPDHSSGLVYILRRFPVDVFYHAGEAADLAPELREILQQRGVAVHHLQQGWTHLHKQGEQTFSVFAPTRGSPDINDHSVAVFAGQRQQGVLLPADLGAEGLQQLAAAGLPGRATLMKLPHHGSRLSQPGRYLDWTQAKKTFTSSGHNNQYGFPHRQTIEACASRQVPLFRTDHDGMLIFRLVKNNWQTHTLGLY